MRSAVHNSSIPPSRLLAFAWPQLVLALGRGSPGRLCAVLQSSQPVVAQRAVGVKAAGGAWLAAGGVHTRWTPPQRLWPPVRGLTLIECSLSFSLFIPPNETATESNVRQQADFSLGARNPIHTANSASSQQCAFTQMSSTIQVSLGCRVCSYEAVADLLVFCCSKSAAACESALLRAALPIPRMAPNVILQGGEPDCRMPAVCWTRPSEQAIQTCGSVDPEQHDNVALRQIVADLIVGYLQSAAACGREPGTLNPKP